jgi:hypothetical protein
MGGNGMTDKPERQVVQIESGTLIILALLASIVILVLCR